MLLRSIYSKKIEGLTAALSSQSFEQLGPDSRPHTCTRTCSCISTSLMLQLYETIDLGTVCQTIKAEAFSESKYTGDKSLDLR